MKAIALTQHLYKLIVRIFYFSNINLWFHRQDTWYRKHWTGRTARCTTSLACTGPYPKRNANRAIWWNMWVVMKIGQPVVSFTDQDYTQPFIAAIPVSAPNNEQNIMLEKCCDTQVFSEPHTTPKRNFARDLTTHFHLVNINHIFILVWNIYMNGDLTNIPGKFKTCKQYTVHLCSAS